MLLIKNQIFTFFIFTAVFNNSISVKLSYEPLPDEHVDLTCLLNLQISTCHSTEIKLQSPEYIDCVVNNTPSLMGACLRVLPHSSPSNTQIPFFLLCCYFFVFISSVLFSRYFHYYRFAVFGTLWFYICLVISLHLLFPHPDLNIPFDLIRFFFSVNISCMLYERISNLVSYDRYVSNPISGRQFLMWIVNDYLYCLLPIFVCTFMISRNSSMADIEINPGPAISYLTDLSFKIFSFPIYCQLTCFNYVTACLLYKAPRIVLYQLIVCGSITALCVIYDDIFMFSPPPFLVNLVIARNSSMSDIELNPGPDVMDRPLAQILSAIVDSHSPLEPMILSSKVNDDVVPCIVRNIPNSDLNTIDYHLDRKSTTASFIARLIFTPRKFYLNLNNQHFGKVRNTETEQFSVIGDIKNDRFLRTIVTTTSYSSGVVVIKVHYKFCYLSPEILSSRWHYTFQEFLDNEDARILRLFDPFAISILSKEVDIRHTRAFPQAFGFGAEIDILGDLKPELLALISQVSAFMPSLEDSSSKMQSTFDKINELIDNQSDLRLKEDLKGYVDKLASSLDLSNATDSFYASASILAFIGSSVNCVYNHDTTSFMILATSMVAVAYFARDKVAKTLSFISELFATKKQSGFDSLSKAIVLFLTSMSFPNVEVNVESMHNYISSKVSRFDSSSKSMASIFKYITSLFVSFMEYINCGEFLPMSMRYMTIGYEEVMKLDAEICAFENRGSSSPIVMSTETDEIVTDFIERLKKIMKIIPRSPETQTEHKLLSNKLSAMESLKKRLNSSCYNASGERVEPVGVLLASPPGIGKTRCVLTIADMFVHAIMSEEAIKLAGNNKKTLVYCRNAGDPYYTGYNAQPVFVVDEMGQAVDMPGDPTNPYLDVVKIINSVEFMPPKAAVEEKGTAPFVSKLFLATTNSPRLQNNSIQDQGALARRLNCFFMVPIEEYCLDPSSDHMERQWDYSKLTKDANGIYDLTGDMAIFCEYRLLDGKVTGRQFNLFELVDYIRMEYDQNSLMFEKTRLERIQLTESYKQHCAFYKAFGYARPMSIKPEAGLIADTPPISMEEVFLDSIDDTPPTSPLMDFHMSDEFMNEFAAMYVTCSKDNTGESLTYYLEDDVATELVDKFIKSLIESKDTESARVAVDRIFHLHMRASFYDIMRDWSVQRLLIAYFCVVGPGFLPLILNTSVTREYVLNEMYTPEIVFKLGKQAPKMRLTKVLFNGLGFCWKKLCEKLNSLFTGMYFQFKRLYTWIKPFIMPICTLLGIWAVKIATQTRGELMEVNDCLAETKKDLKDLDYDTAEGLEMTWDDIDRMDSKIQEIMLRLSKAKSQSTKKPNVHNQKSIAQRMAQLNPIKSQMGSGRNVFNQSISIITSNLIKISFDKPFQGKTFIGQAFMVVDTICMMPNHYVTLLLSMAEANPECLNRNVIIEYGKGFTVNFMLKDILNKDSLSSTDIGKRQDYLFIRFPRCVKTFRDATKLFATVADVEKIGKVMKANLFGLGASGIAQSCVTAKSIRDVDIGGKSLDYSIDHAYFYKARTQEGDCGAMLCYDGSIDQMPPLIGFHTAGNDSQECGYSSVVSREDVLLGISYFSEVLIADPIDIAGSPPEGKILGQSCFDPIIKADKAPSRPTRSSMCRLPSFGWTEEPVEYFPVSAFPKGADGERFDALLLNYDQFPSEFPALDEDILRASVQSTFDHLENVSINDVERRVWSIKEAILGIDCEYSKGIPINTSPGYPLNCDKHEGTGKEFIFGKRDVNGNLDLNRPEVLELISVCERVLAKLELGHAYNEAIFTDFAKMDELKTLIKIAAGKLRLVCAVDLVSLVLTRVLFGALCVWINANHTVNGTAIGTNPYCSDWDYMARQLKKFDHMGFSDYKAFDKNQQGRITWAIIDAINKWYNDGHDLARKAISLTIIQSKHILDGIIYEWLCALPSGNVLTIIINCLYNMVSFRYCFVVANGRVLVMAWVFNKYVVLFVMGDDNIYSVHESYVEVFNMKTIEPLMRDHLGLKITPASKEGEFGDMVGIEDIDFLKRMFVYEPLLGKWKAPIHLDVIKAMGNFGTRKGDKEANTIMSLNNAYLELSYQTQEVWDKYFPRLERAMRDISGEGFPIRHRGYCLLANYRSI
jgi:hypothetical protein